MSLILIVDDMPALRDQYAYDLKRLGGFDDPHRQRRQGRAQILETEPVDCVILDLEMPGVDGFEVLAAIRASGRDMPVIVYTGTGSYDRCVRAVKLGAYSFIAKDEPLDGWSARWRTPWPGPPAPRGRRRCAAERRGTPSDRRERGHGAERGHRPAGPHSQPRADPGRERQRQGTGGPRAPPAGQRRPGSLRGRQLRRPARDHGRERTLRPRGGRLHRRRPRAQGRLRDGRAAARCSWTRSASSRCRPRPSCCACSRTGR